MEILPPKPPNWSGLKVTVMVHVALTATEAGQLLVCVNSVFPLAIALMVSAAVPVLVRVTDCVALLEPTLVLGKLRDVGASVTKGASTPVPLSETACGLLVALSVKVRVPVREPAAVGVKVTLMEQAVFPGRTEEQLLVREKSPVATIEEIFNCAVPELVRVTVCAAL